MGIFLFKGKEFFQIDATHNLIDNYGNAISNKMIMSIVKVHFTMYAKKKRYNLIPIARFGSR